ncbi:4-oxalomesaconate tautomerase [Mumia flava]|uniref:4-oxalomesaconate tautomerase n=2 Tax=Mumia flava TaxID=1348852 RepID=A0A0B2BFC9_9ACTN|nr:4-oxalomesaconate tautomerase [Mumia flava]
MRGGTSKGALFLAEDLPSDDAARDDLLLRVMGSPDPRQIDGLGGAHPLTSKVGVVSVSDDPDADVDYLFLQVVVDRPVVSTSQTCGNILAAVAPFALERGLLPTTDGVTDVRVRMVNTGALATLHVRTPGGVVTYDGDVAITGVPGTAAPVEVDVEPSGAPLLPTGRTTDRLAGVDVTCIDNGMPSVIVRAADVGLSGAEDPDALEADPALAEKVRAIRTAAADAMGLETDLERTTTPKIVFVAPPAAGGTILTRSFIPVHVHRAIGVLGAATVAAAAALPGTTAYGVARLGDDGGALRIEHPTGYLDVGIATTDDPAPAVTRTTLVRTARMLLDGVVYPGPARTTRPV